MSVFKSPIERQSILQESEGIQRPGLEVASPTCIQYNPSLSEACWVQSLRQAERDLLGVDGGEGVVELADDVVGVPGAGDDGRES